MYSFGVMFAEINMNHQVLEFVLYVKKEYVSDAILTLIYIIGTPWMMIP
jgi:hypothetical protein